MRFQALTLLSLLTVAGCGELSFGEMPALCSTDGACPEGYDCIHGVCALPGTPVPITVAQAGSIRGNDVRMVQQGNNVLVTWESYAYFADKQKFFGARVSPDGLVSSRMELVGRFVAEDASLEPYFDVLPVDGDRVLVSISAPSLADDSSSKPRLITYRSDLPPVGNESSPPKYEAAWGAEQRLDTVGYGAVSSPKLVDRGDTVEVGYVRSRTTAMATVADLAVFSLQRDGTLKAPDATYHPVRKNLSVAVGVFGALRSPAGTWWVLDDERPSALYLLDAGAEVEAPLGRLAIPVATDDSSLLYIFPSDRQGDKLATSLVSGEAQLRQVAVADVGGALETSEVTLGSLPTIRDFPRPAWLSREGKTAIVATSGQDAFSPNILVYTVDPKNGDSKLVSTIPRFSTRLVEALRMLLIGDKLFVAWLETDADAGAIRMSILPVP